jgi:hypothetical protein
MALKKGLTVFLTVGIDRLYISALSTGQKSNFIK